MRFVWRIQKTGPLPGAPHVGRVIHHSRWRAALGACRCIGCCLRRSS